MTYPGLLLVALLCVVVSAHAGGASAESPGPHFFVKASKSIPRIGRRNDFHIPATKSVPRMGKKSLGADYVDRTDLGSNPVHQGEIPKPVYLVRYARDGAMQDSPAKREDWDPETFSWRDIDRLMEERPDLWRRVQEASLPSEPEDDGTWRRLFEA